MKKKASNKEKAKQQALKDMKCDGITYILPTRRENSNYSLITLFN